MSRARAQLRTEPPSRAAFTCTPLSSSRTFLVTEPNDIYSERPFIYALVRPSANTIVIVDTGCGGASTKPDVEITSLRQFIETVEIASNDGKPLNEGGEMGYIIVLSHCHYDHILAIEQFTAAGRAPFTQIHASSHSPSFLSPSNLPEHSLCTALHIPTPQYMPTLVPHLHRITVPPPSLTSDLGLTLLHTPGHTPDSLAMWDAHERMLYVGDTLYEHEPIIFPKEASIVVWLQTADYLIDFVRTAGSGNDAYQDARTPTPEVRINCGHATAGIPALPVLSGAKEFMLGVISGRERVRGRSEKRGEVTVEYGKVGDRFRLVCPERLVKEVINLA